MAEEIGLNVRVKLQGERGSMDRLKTDIEKSVSDGASKGAKRPLPLSLKGVNKDLAGGAPGKTGGGFGLADLGGMLKGDMSKLAGGGAAMGAGAGAAGALGAAAGPLMAIFALVEIGKTNIEIMQKMFSFLVESSPMLQGAMKMIHKAIMLFLMPIGNLIAQLLMPLARNAMETAVKTFQQSGTYAQDGKSMIQQITMTIADALQTMVPVLIDILIQVIPPVLIGVGAAIGKIIIDFFVWLSVQMAGEARKSLQAVWNVISGFGQWLWDTITGAIGSLGDAIGGFGNWLYTSIKSAIGSLGSILGGFGTWLYTSIKNAIGGLGEALGGLGNWLYEGITGAIGTLGDAIGGFGSWLYTSMKDAIGSFANGIGQFGSWLWTSVKNAIGDIGNSVGKIGYELYKFFHNAIAGLLQAIRNIDLGWPVGKPFTFIPDIPYLAEGGIVTRPTLAVLGERGPEKVIPLGKEGGGGTQVIVNINAPVFGVNDLDRKIEQAIRASSYRLRGA